MWRTFMAAGGSRSSRGPDSRACAQPVARGPPEAAAQRRGEKTVRWFEEKKNKVFFFWREDQETNREDRKEDLIHRPLFCLFWASSVFSRRIFAAPRVQCRYGVHVRGGPACCSPPVLCRAPWSIDGSVFPPPLCSPFFVRVAPGTKITWRAVSAGLPGLRPPRACTRGMAARPIRPRHAAAPQSPRRRRRRRRRRTGH